MKTDGRSPFTHGMEIEQFPGEVPRAVENYTMNNSEGSLDGWHNDASGPRETSIGAYKTTKAILNRFYTDTRDEDLTWDWHASDGTPGNRAAGAGSHVHLNVAEDVFDDTVTAWTIAYNTVAEVFPFLAPFFCHNWQDGFRDGTYYRSGTLNVKKWAEGQLTRLSPDSVRDRVENPTGYRREYASVTFNPAQTSGKPLTIELRANDAHPAMACNGLLLIRRLTARAIEEGWSPKLENHRETLRACYEKIYERATEVGLIRAMKEPIEGGIVFQEGRGMPDTDQREFDTMWEVLRSIQIAYPQTPGTWRKRACKLVRAGSDACSPHRNTDALWNIDADGDDFEWEHGPEEAPDGADRKTDTVEVTA